MNHRNSSSEGTFGNFDGDRIPNRPYLFANSAIRLKWFDVLSGNDEVGLGLRSRYVEEFFRGWESVGLRAFKATVPSQLTHTLALTYRQERATHSLTFAAEAKNITDEEVFDFFGVQRPGRSFHVKAILEF